ncbi:MAG: hypothetical protein MI861_20010, partial [Pirellulales bacterium]|nr:hypothetical protein [Pirellulales bacterium]
MAPALEDPPALPQDHYKTFLRYGKEETDKAIVQETIDHTIQKNLPRHVKSIAKKKKSGNLGLGRNISTLQKLSLHKDRMVALRDVREAVGNAHWELTQLANAAKERACKDSWDSSDYEQDNNIPTLARQQLDGVKSDTDAILKILDYHIETLQSLVRRRDASESDGQYLQMATKVRSGIEFAIKQAEKACGPNPGINNHGISEANAKAMEELSGELQKLADVWADKPLPPGLQDVRNNATLRKVGKPLAETLSAKDRRRIADSQRLNQISKLLRPAVRGGLTKLSRKMSLRWLKSKRRRKLDDQVDERDRMLSYAKAVIAARHRKYNTGLNDHFLPRENQDAESYARYLLSDSLNKEQRAQFIKTVQGNLKYYKSRGNVSLKDLVQIYHANNKAHRYAKVVFEAVQAGLDLSNWGLPNRICPRDVNNEPDLKDAQSYGQFVSQLSDNDQQLLFDAVDQQVAAWQREYKTLADNLKPKNIFQK